MSIWDNIKKFAQPYSNDEDYDDYADELDSLDNEPEEKAAPAGRRPSPFATSSADSSFQSSTPSGSGFNGQVLNMNSGPQW